MIPHGLLEALILFGVSDTVDRPRFRLLVPDDVFLGTEGFARNVSPGTVSLTVVISGCSVGLEDGTSPIGVSSLFFGEANMVRHLVLPSVSLLGLFIGSSGIVDSR